MNRPEYSDNFLHGILISMIGDYISTSIVGNQAFPGIIVAFAPQHGKFAESIYTAALNVVGGAVRSNV